MWRIRPIAHVKHYRNKTNVQINKPKSTNRFKDNMKLEKKIVQSSDKLSSTIPMKYGNDLRLIQLHFYFSTMTMALAFHCKYKQIVFQNLSIAV